MVLKTHLRTIQKKHLYTSCIELN